MFYTLGGALPPFFVGAGQFSPVSGAVRGAAAGAQSAPARPPARPADGLVLRAQPAKPPPPAPGVPPAGGAHTPKGRPGHCDPPLSLAISSPPQTIPFACTPAGNYLPARRSRTGGGGGRAKRARRPAPGPPPASVGAHTPKAIGLNSCPKNAKKWPTATFLQCAILR